jgi:hypothetical protein
MSYALYPYMVKIKSIDAVFASQDESLLNDLVIQQKTKIQALKEDIDSELSPIEAIKEIFSGQLSKQDDPVMYTYICELICAALGTQLPATEWNNLSMNWLMDVNMEACLPMTKIPLPKDFPYVLTIPFAELEEFIDIMGALDLEDEEPWIEFETWVALLNREKGDLVIFFY